MLFDTCNDAIFIPLFALLNTTMDYNDNYFDDEDYHYPKPEDFTELNYTDEIKNIQEKLIIVEDPKQYFEQLSFNESKICENIVETPDISFLGHSQLLDRITSTPNFPNLIFIASKIQVHSFNIQTKEVGININDGLLNNNLILTVARTLHPSECGPVRLPPYFSH